MTLRKAKKEIRAKGWVIKEYMHENGVLRLQVVTKKGKPKTLTVDQ